MVVKIFLTGATGYVGGNALAHIIDAHPDYEYTLLVRSEAKAEPIKARYPNVNFVCGSLDDADIVEKAAAEADIVVHTAESADNVPGAKAIAKGIARGHSAAKPGYWIHTSGTSILTWYDNQEKRFGDGPVPEQKYDDIDDIDRLLTLPDEAYHRDVDKIVQSANSDAVRVAIVCPPTIYGTGSGPVNTRSIQVPDLAKSTLEKGYAPIVGAGQTEWDHVHVADLGTLFVKLVEAAQDPVLRVNQEVFGPHGYFFAKAGSHRWADVAKRVAEEAARQGYLPAPVTKEVAQREVELMGSAAGFSYGLNSKGTARRARQYLGWQARGGTLWEDISKTVAAEARALGLTAGEGHAATAF